VESSEAARGEATELLRRWQGERRSLLASIVERSLELNADGACAKDVAIAYGIVGRRVVLVREGDSVDLEMVLNVGSRLRETVISEARGVLGR
jgi:hypothetical protein